MGTITVSSSGAASRRKEGSKQNLLCNFLLVKLYHNKIPTLSDCLYVCMYVVAAYVFVYVCRCLFAVTKDMV